MPYSTNKNTDESLLLYIDTETDYKTAGGIELNNDSSEINDVIIYLHTNYQSRITINDLTKNFHINRTTLSEKFRLCSETPCFLYQI